jgi:hypothetical protein
MPNRFKNSKIDKIKLKSGEIDKMGEIASLKPFYDFNKKIISYSISALPHQH